VITGVRCLRARESIHRLNLVDGQPDAVITKEEMLIRDGFGSQTKFRSLIAEWDGQAIGYALFFGFYSSWKGSGIFLEVLFVREAFRGPRFVKRS
jgi:hypothetical protein